MNLGTLSTRTLTRLDEVSTNPEFYGSAVSAINWAQRMFVLLSLPLETTATFDLTAVTTWYHARDQFTDWLLPLRVDFDGTKVRPATLAQLDDLDAAWQAKPGNPERYAHLGLDLLALYKQVGDADTLSLTYARGPVPLVAAADTPEIPEEYHPLLIDGAIVYLRMVEGGQEFAKVQPLLGEFLSGARKLGNYVRQRSKDLRYDSFPVELTKLDLSRVLAIEKKGPSNG